MVTTRATLRTLAFAGTVCACLFALQRMARQAHDLEEHLVRSDGWSVVSAPEWMDRKILGSLVEDAPRAVSIFSPDLVDHYEAALSRHLWVERVESTRRIYPDGVEITMRVRKPIALVAMDHGGGLRYYLVDRHGRRLPDHLETVPTPAPYPLPLLLGIRGGVPEPGAEFEDPAVVHGTRVALELYAWHNSSLHQRLPVQRIDMSNFEGRVDQGASEVVLYASPRVRGQQDSVHEVPIHWGRAPRRSSVELDAAAKVALIEVALSEYPGLQGVEVVKLHLGELMIEKAEDPRPTG